MVTVPPIQPIIVAMELSESFALLGISTPGDADSKYDRYRPRLNWDGSIAFSDIDGRRIESTRVREIAQWVSTLEDNDDLTHAIVSMGERKLRTIGTKLTMYITDARIAFADDRGKSVDDRLVGHVRYPWVQAIVWRPRMGRFRRPKLQIWMHEDFPVKRLGRWDHYIEVELDDSTDAGAIALALARRVSAHNLAHGAPEPIHERLREQSRITHLPETDETGEGLWPCPAFVACPNGAEYVGDSVGQAEWICPGLQADEDPQVIESDDREKQAPSLLFVKRMLTRGKSIARERGHHQVGVDDLLLAVLLDPESPVGKLLARHGVDYESLKLQLDAQERRPEK